MAGSQGGAVMSIFDRMFRGKEAPATAADRLSAAQLKLSELRRSLNAAEDDLPDLEAQANSAMLDSAIEQGKATADASRKADEALAVARRNVEALSQAIEALQAEIVVMSREAEREEREAIHQQRMAKATAGLKALPDLEKRGQKLLAEFEEFAAAARKAHGTIPASLASAIWSAARGEDVAFEISADAKDELTRGSEGDFQSAEYLRDSVATERDRVATAERLALGNARNREWRANPPKIVRDGSSRGWVEA